MFWKDLVNFICSLEKPDVILTLGIAFLTVLIPLAIAILQSIYQKKGAKTEFANLDLHVILDSVFNIKRLLFSICLIFIPLLPWKASLISPSKSFSSIYRMIALFVSSLGIFLVGKTIYNVYRWVKGNAFRFRFSYLKRIKNHEDLEVVWRSVWEVENINSQDETTFFEIFSSTIDNLLKTNNSVKRKNLKTALRLLEDFSKYMNIRSIFALIRLEVFPKILEWHRKAFEEEKRAREKGIDEWNNYHKMLHILSNIVEEIAKRSLKEGLNFLFFEPFKEHAENYKFDNRYIDSLIGKFARVFFDNIEDFAKNNVWDSFPKEWKVTKDNYENNNIPQVFLDKFLEWAQGRILQAKEELDRTLDDVTKNLFPEVDPISWSAILIFVMSPYGENRVKSVIERPWTFGFWGRPRTYWVEYSNDIESFRKRTRIEKRNTLELADLLFPKQFSKEKLRDYIKDLKSLEYEKESKEEIRRLRLLRIFEEMLELKSMKLTEHRK